MRTRIDWQYLLGLGLDDPGFGHSVLPEFRGKVAEGGLEQVALDALLGRLAADGLVKAGGKQRTDSTHVVAAVAALNRLELAGESVRAALEALTAKSRSSTPASRTGSDPPMTSPPKSSACSADTATTCTSAPPQRPRPRTAEASRTGPRRRPGTTPAP